jgi:diguanylate cyclase (GGDEF)-like protein
MSMYRQFWLAIILSTMLAFVGSFLAATYSSRTYISNQLQMKNTDNATVLALSLSQKATSPVDLELVISALFDGGHYAYIKFTDPNGKVVLERKADEMETDVPAWFMERFPLHATPGQAQVSNGWKQLGTISLASQYGSAYQALWEIAQKLFATLALSALMAGALGGLILQRLKRPLHAVVDQAIAMRERRFISTDESDVPELKELSTSMNATAALLKTMFADEAERIEQLRRRANTDPVTGLENRSHFIAQLHVMLETPDAAPGRLILVRLSQLAEINRQFGHNRADAILRQVGELILAQSTSLNDGFAARLNGTDFALLFTQNEPDLVAFKLVEAINRALPKMDGAPAAAFIGFTTFDVGIEMGALLSEVDAAVASAELSGTSNMQRAAPLNIEQAPRTSDEWSKLIARALEQRWVKLELFSVASMSGQLLHRESALRLMFGAEWFPAGRFLPIAERLGLTAQLDLAATGLALTELGRDETLSDIAINLSAQSIRDADFRANLSALLATKPALAKRLWIEIPENGILANIDAFRVFYNEISSKVDHIGMEHFGKQFDRIDAIYDLKLDYIKMDGSFIRNIDQNDGNQAFVKGANTIAHRIGVKLYAENVSTVEELDSLRRLGIDGVTGPVVKQAFGL